MSDKIISRRHPFYDAWSSQWEFFTSSYIGGQTFIAANLFKYFKEGQTEYDARKLRAYRENHCKRVVDLVNSYLFKESPVRKTENKYLTDFIKNINGKGHDADKFMKGASQWASVCGRIYLVIDKKPLPPEEKTGTQADNLKGTPYIYTVFPQNVLDIAFDDDGRVKWAIIKENYRDDDDPRTASNEVKSRFRLWEVGKWTLYDDAGKETDTGETGLDCVPIVIVDNEEQDTYGGQSLIADVAYLDRAIFNNWSRLDTIVCDQTFSQLIFPIEGLSADILNNETLREQFLTLATNRIILYSAQAEVAPTFISPDAAQAEFILTMIGNQTKQLYASLGLQSETGEEVKDASGVAKAYDFDKLNKLLAGKADNLEMAERQIFKIVKQWMGNISGDIEVEYPDEFDVRGLAGELDIAERVALLDISDKLMVEVNKNIAHKALPKASKEIIDEINTEIEAKSKEPAEEEFDAGEFGNDKPKGNKKPPTKPTEPTG